VNRLHWSAAPEGATPVQKKNFLNVQIDAVGIGLASAAAPFLPVFLTRLGATNFQVGLLTSMPAFTGLLSAIAVGAFLQSRRNIVPWFSAARLLVVLSYALTGLAPFVVPRQYVVQAVLAIWMAVTLPQIVVNVAFSVVMNAVAGPKGRYALMSRRWSILGLTTAVTVTIAGQMLDRIHFPLNYQVVFIALSVGGLISYYFSSHIQLPDAERAPRTARLSLLQRFKNQVGLVRNERPFLSFTAKQFVYIAGSTLAAPLFPIYYVRQVQATDAWIGIITSVQMAITLVGYLFWARQGRVRGSRFVLLATTLGMAIYPALIASTRRVEWIAVYAGLAGIFQAGLNLVFFDELMKTVPVQHSATFVSLSQSSQYLSTVAAPLVGTFLADAIGVGGGLVVSTLLRLAGFGLFAWGGARKPMPGTQAVKTRPQPGKASE
jgi:MFS family permease